MKVILHYEEPDDSSLHKSLKITLPKSWKSGPTSRLLQQFVESYNAIEELGGHRNPLDLLGLHLAIRKADGDKSILSSLPSDAAILDCIPDRADLYVVNGPSQSLAELEQIQQEERKRRQEELQSTVACTRFGCKNRFPKGGPYPDCQYHLSPPVFHETAKFWSCCPHKKAYDWEDFQSIPGCQTGKCTEIKEEGKLFLGGSDLREQAGEAVKLKSIDDFNKAQAAGGSEAAPVLERLQRVLEELGIEKELFEQVVAGYKAQFEKVGGANETEVLEQIKAELGSKLKTAMKSMAADQLRIS